MNDNRPLLLIIDDDSAARDSLAAVMEAFGFRTCTAGDAFEGLALVNNEEPSAIITDLEMPGMSGFELIQTLRRTRTGIPVIAMSGGAAKDIDAARDLGATAAFQKPLAVFEMIDTVCGITARSA